nr:hypothetical protein [uncultured Dongia sp.]
MEESELKRLEKINAAAAERDRKIKEEEKARMAEEAATKARLQGARENWQLIFTTLNIVIQDVNQNIREHGSFHASKAASHAPLGGCDVLFSGKAGSGGEIKFRATPMGSISVDFEPGASHGFKNDSMVNPPALPFEKATRAALVSVLLDFLEQKIS